MVGLCYFQNCHLFKFPQTPQNMNTIGIAKSMDGNYTITPYTINFDGRLVTLGAGIQRVFSTTNPQLPTPINQHIHEYAEQFLALEMKSIFHLNKKTQLPNEFIQNVNKYCSLCLAYEFYNKSMPESFFYDPKKIGIEIHTTVECLNSSLDDLRLSGWHLASNLSREQKLALFISVYKTTLEFIDNLLLLNDQVSQQYITDGELEKNIIAKYKHLLVPRELNLDWQFRLIILLMVLLLLSHVYLT